MITHRATRISMIAAGALLAAGMACSAPGGTAQTPTALTPPTDAAPAITEAPTEAAMSNTGGEPCTPPMPDASIPDGASWLVYCSEAYGFSFRYPAGGAALGNNPTQGRIYLPITAGTNLAEKYLTVTTSPNAVTCQSPNTEGHDPGSIPSEAATFNGVNFVRQASGEAGAGNIYDWVGYSDLSGTLCLSVTFILHSSDVGAFATPPPVFDKTAETAVFEQIMATFGLADAIRECFIN